MTRFRLAVVAAAVALVCGPFASAQQRTPQAVSQAGGQVNAAPAAPIVAPAGGVLGKGRPVAEDNGLPVIGRNITTHAKCTVGIDDACTTAPTTAGGSDATAANQTTQITAANTTNTELGALGLSACATDNGSCSINELLKRNNQRVTSLITALGTPLQAGGSVSIAPAAADVTEASGTVAAANVFQTAFSANGSRTNCFIQNPANATEALYIHWASSSPTLLNSASLGPGSSFNCTVNGVVVRSLIQLTAATIGHAYVAAGS